MTITTVSEQPPGLSFAQYATCLKGIVWREGLRFLHQRERFISALVRPLVWLFIFAAGFRQVLGVSIIPPYETYILYEVYITPGLMAMIQLFNGMQSSLSMVYDREMGNMRTLLVSPLPRWYLLVLQAACRNGGLHPPGLCISADRVVLGYSASHDRVPHGHSRAHAVRTDARCPRHADLIRHQAAGEFRRRHELRDLPDVLRVIGSVPAVARAGRKPDALLCLPIQPVHPCSRTHPLRALRTNQLGVPERGRRMHDLFMVAAVIAYDPSRGLLRRAPAGGETT